MKFSCLSLLFFLHVLFCHATEEAKECTDNRFDECHTGHGYRNVSATPSTHEELEELCLSFNKSDSCEDEYVKECFTEIQQLAFYDEVDGVRQYHKALCTPGPKQDDYLHHFSCLVNVTLGNNCASKLTAVTQLFENGTYTDGTLKEACSLYNKFVCCKFSQLSDYCEKESTDFLLKHMHDVLKPPRKFCKHYTDAGYNCQPSEQSSELSSGSILSQMSCPFIILIFLISKKYICSLY